MGSLAVDTQALKGQESFSDVALEEGQAREAGIMGVSEAHAHLRDLPGMGATWARAALKNLELKLADMDEVKPAEKALSSAEVAQRAAWIRAALLGAQDGLVSVSSLIIGVSAISDNHNSVFASGLAGLVAGACSMAIGEYVSVQGQRDIEEAELLRKRAELGSRAELAELDEGASKATAADGAQNIPLAKQDAQERESGQSLAMMELERQEEELARPLPAALASGLAFTTGAIVPLSFAAIVTTHWLRALVVLLVSTVMFLLFGFIGACLGGAPRLRATIRTAIGGWLALAITFGTLSVFGAAGLTA